MNDRFTNETEFVVVNNANASFTTVMNYIFDDKNISFKAQGIYCQIIRYQNSATHKLYISSLVKQKTDGKAAIAAGIKELIEHGYITKENIRNEKGQIKGVRYQVFTMPLTENRLSEISKSEIGKSDAYNKNTDITKIDKKENKDICSSTDEAVTEIILYLNEKCGTKFKQTTKDNRKHIGARLKDEYTVDDCKMVIDIKCKQWLSNDEFRKNLNPVTLFRAGNFERYYNEGVVAKPVVIAEEQLDDKAYYVTPDGVETKYTREYMLSDLVETRWGVGGEVEYWGVEPDNLTGGYIKLDI